ncbi:MAG: DNA-binding MarR family transcriptional regulator [Psychromonas sp.]|jgi:DNA-binding MarR family transcriptional regulator|uniref:MarR family winged helix-turn-helix transcriptional regulator n=1 Tax=Psychromonas sp. TaxID=1884585 RepID=UPI0039E5E93A
MKNDTIPDTVLSLSLAYRLAMRSALKANEIGLNLMHVKCLSFIKKHESCTANDIVNYFVKDKAQIARLIKEMIDKNWLKKIANPKDKRSQLLSLTEEGKLLGELISQTQNDVHQKMQENLTAQELQEFERVAKIISANISLNR